MNSMSTVHADDQPTLSTPPEARDTTELTTSIATATDRCPNCGARRAAAQLYCNHNGEHRTGGGTRVALLKRAVGTARTRIRFFFFQAEDGIRNPDQAEP